ncbi:MAG: hypothetical protein ACHQNT_05265 [Bacteroidia bacterium]
MWRKLVRKEKITVGFRGVLFFGSFFCTSKRNEQKKHCHVRKNQFAQATFKTSSATSSASSTTSTHSSGTAIQIKLQTFLSFY